MESDEEKRPVLHCALADALKETDSKRCVTFHSTIAGARAFAKQHPAYTRTDTKCWSITSRESASARSESLIEFINHNGRAVLSNSKLFTEGVDAPTVDAIGFVDPKSSVVDIVQAVGRAIRRDPNKADKRATILVPVYTRGDLSDEDIAAQGATTLINVVFALKSQDVLLAKIIDAQTDPDSPSRNVVCDSCGLFLHECACYYTLAQLTSAHRASIRSVVLERTSEDWNWNQFAKLTTDWYAVHDRHPSHGSKDPDEKRIGMWCAIQRLESDKGHLPPRRKERLEAIDGWSWDPNEDMWTKSFKNCVAWYSVNKEHPNMRSPVTAERKAGAFVNQQRFRYRTGKLPEERIQQLNSISGWSWDGRLDAWNDKWREMADWITANQRWPTDTRDPAERRISKWLVKQRMGYHAKRLSQARIKALESVAGWTWDAMAQRWNDRASQAVRWYSQHREHPNKKSSFKDERSLAAWIAGQRNKFRNGSLEREKIKTLESIDGWAWDAYEKSWADRYDQLVKWIESNGDEPDGSSMDSAEGELGSWVKSQRAAFNRGSMADHRVQSLQEIGGWSWNRKDDGWTIAYQQVATWYEDNNGAHPPFGSTDREKKRLYQWVQSRRVEYRSGQLADERIAALESIQGWSWEATHDAWQNGFALAKDWYAKHSRHPSSRATEREEAKVRNWVHFQRRLKKNNEIPEERELALESIPGWSWHPKQDAWNNAYNNAKAWYAKTDRHPSQNSEDTAEKTLCGWIGTQRKARKRGTLSGEHEAALDAIDGWKW